ncbi:radical SAM protein with 4Fe4S-binding SPASM domain [Rhodopseudomonas julia]|uniref:Radical SAM protein with 4Fe4S-binding SPASM domain n=1 Tax=Rhodopseudomonas julia TaxID=200617 RepID=A0ABU0C3A7_9BRAD|nr:radical SAM protein [Rhodopseudomonas julia]MDQ0324994.1 radical SAM protein with 4Fe4S-binding SPASM domain [Rhodopseudomonas julia]
MKEADLDTRTLQLVTTERCNLKCRYCFEQVKRNRDMPVATALAKVEKYLTLDDGFDGLLIDFFGGEPLLRFELIREVVDFVHSRPWPKRHHFNVGTNLTLLDEDKKAWLAHHRGCLTVSTSLDGTKRAHDFNRWESYDDVVRHVPFLRENWPDQPVKMTIGADMIEEVAAGIIEILEMGLFVEANVVFENVWGEGAERQAKLATFSHQLDELVAYFTRHPELSPPRFVDLGIAALPGLAPGENRKWCGTGRYMVAVDVDGVEYPCHRFTPYASNHAAERHAREGFGAPVTDCSACPVVAVCPTCHAYNWEVTGDEDKRVGYHCDFIRLQFHATARLQYNRNRAAIRQLAKGEIDETVDPAELAALGRLIKGIALVQEKLPLPTI